MRHRRNIGSYITVIVFASVLSACAGHLSPDASAAAQANLKRLNVATAINDATDGIILANSQQWLNDDVTKLVLVNFHVVLDTLPSSTNPVNLALGAVESLKQQAAANYPAEAQKLAPYLASLETVLNGVK